MKSKNITWKHYLRNGFGRRLAQLGEAVGSDALIYNSLVMQNFHDEAVRNAPKVIPAVLKVLPESRRFLDIGCGSGAFSAELQRLGMSVIGLERSPHGRKLALGQGIDCRDFDLTREPAAVISEAFDVVFCFEVAEHLPAVLGDKLTTFMANFKSTVLFSAAQPGQGGTGHINEQPPDYWRAKFVDLGFRYDEEQTQFLRSEFVRHGAASWFCNNPILLHPPS